MTPDEILNEILDDCADRNIATDGDKLLKALNDNGYAVIGAAELAGRRAELAKVTAERDEAIAAKKAKHKEMFEATNYYEDLVREIEAEHDAAREALAKAVEAEREACAKMAEDAWFWNEGHSLAAAIRARKEPTP